jgi:hypothetical protein
MVFKTLLIVLVFTVLLEDSASIKKTVEEKQEDEELAKRVNATLAEEEEKKRQEEEEKKKDEIKKDETKKKDKIKEKDEKDPEEENRNKEEDGVDEACLPANCSCPIVEPCPKEKECPTPVKPSKPCEDCPVCKECGQCPVVRPCEPCAPGNTTTVDPPSSGCPDPASMSVPVALAVGAMASLLVTGVAAAIGLLLRYVSPIVSGFLFLATIVILWYLCSQYPETARELGGRAAALVRDAAVALSHRVMEALRHHHEQVSFPIKPYLFLRMSSMFPKVCTKIFYVTENNF